MAKRKQSKASRAAKISGRRLEVAQQVSERKNRRKQRGQWTDTNKGVTYERVAVTFGPVKTLRQERARELKILKVLEAAESRGATKAWVNLKWRDGSYSGTAIQSPQDTYRKLLELQIAYKGTKTDHDQKRAAVDVVTLRVTKTKKGSRRV